MSTPAIVVVAEGGLIEDCIWYEDVNAAIVQAKEIWEGLDPECDDVKVFNTLGEVEWQPSDEGEKRIVGG